MNSETKGLEHAYPESISVGRDLTLESGLIIASTNGAQLAAVLVRYIIHLTSYVIPLLYPTGIHEHAGSRCKINGGRVDAYVN